MTNVIPNMLSTKAAKTLGTVMLATIGLGTMVSAAPPGPLPFGVYDPEGTFKDDAEVSIEHLFLPWEDVFLPSLHDADAYAQERNRVLLVTIEPWTWTVSERNRPETLIAGIQSGDYDHYMRSICEVLNKVQSPVTVRWAQEMEDKSGQFIWSNWQPEVYISSYKRMVDVCRSEAPKVDYMWSPLGFENLNLYYPGDDYVDIIGLSVFGLQRWETNTLGFEQSFKDIFEPRYNRVLGYGKPIMVAELGYSGNAAYIEEWENSIRQIYPEFPELIAVSYFNQKEVYPWPNGFGIPDWRIEHRTDE